MKLLLALAIVVIIEACSCGTTVAALNNLQNWTTPSSTHTGCIAFSPYVTGYTAGQNIPISLVKSLMTNIAQNTKYKCLMLYSLNSPWTEIARQLGLKVLGIVWLTNVRSANNVQINQAISTIKTYPTTVIGVSCGSEMGYRWGKSVTAANEVLNCVNMVRNSKTTIPIGSNDALPTWNSKWYEVSNSLDWLGVNIYPWYDNPRGCTAASAAGYQTYVRFLHTKSLYNRPLLMTEFGWPSGGTVGCGVGSVANQKLVVQDVINRFRTAKLPAITFGAYKEPWKNQFGAAESQWGICQGIIPYKCTNTFK